MSPCASLNWIDDVRPKGRSGIRNGCTDRGLRKLRMRGTDILDALTGGQFFKDEFDGNASAGDNRLAHHYARIGNDQGFVHESLFLG